MFQKLHKNARTNYSIRKEIQESQENINVLAKKFALSWKTVKKWRTRKTVEDKTSRPKKLKTTLSQFEEDLIVFERKEFKKTIEEIYFSLEKKIENIYPVKIYRVLKRYHLSVLPNELIKAERKIRKFHRYNIGYLHLDSLWVPKITDKKRRYIYTAIDRVSKLAFIQFSEDKKIKTSTGFLHKVLDFYPYKINYILTDNGIEFSYNQLPKIRRPKNKIHFFDQICRDEKIQHRTIKFKHPWTNGMVERFNGKIKDRVFRRYIFENIPDLKEKLTTFINEYNFKVKLKQINYQSPAEFLKNKHGYFVQPIVI